MGSLAGLVILSFNGKFPADIMSIPFALIFGDLVPRLSEKSTSMLYGSTSYYDQIDKFTLWCIS